MNPILQYLQSQIDKTDVQSPSPIGQWLNGVLKSAEPGQLTMEYIVRKDMLNPAQTLHGGVASMIIDELIGMATFSLNTPNLYTSINLQVDFLRPAKLGDILRATAKTIRQGNQVIHMECQVLNEAGEIVAKSSSNMGRTNKSNAMYQAT